MPWSAGQTGQPIATGRPLYGHAVSPDGRRMIIDAQHADREPYPEVAVLNLSDSSVQLLSLLSKPRMVHWSPNGLQLLYVHTIADSGDELVLYDFASGDNTPIAAMPNIVFAAGWSADGDQIAFLAEDDGQYDVYVLDVATRAVRRLTNTPAVEVAIAWSPVGRALLVGATPDNEPVLREGPPYAVTALHLIDSDGQSRLLDTYETFVSSNSLAWSADGQRIALSNAGALCILELTTSHTTCPLADAEPFGSYFIEEQPAWSTDDRWLAFRGTGFENGLCFGVYALEVATGEVSIVEEGSCETGPLYWVDDLEGATH